MSKVITMYQVKKMLATMRTIHTDHGDIDISENLLVQSLLEKVLFRHFKKIVDDAYESGETVDWLVEKYKEHKERHKLCTKDEKGVSLDGEVVLDNPRPTGDGKINAKSPKKPEAK